MTSSQACNLGTPVSIFISCSPEDDPKVERFSDELRTKTENVNINFSFQGNTEDSVSQQLRYQAVESSECMVAFLSPNYFSSRICLEEYNIALAKQLSHNAFYLLPIHTAAVEQIPRSLSSLPCVDVSGGESQIVVLAEIVDQILKEFKAAHRLQKPDVKILKEKLEEKRASEFTEKFRLDGGNITWRTASSSLDYRITGRVVFLCAQDCLTFAAILSAILKQHAAGLISEILTQPLSSHAHPDQSFVPANADVVIAFISDQFAASAILNAELHLVLCRQRSSRDVPVVYTIQSQHQLSYPLFLHVLPLPVCLDDKIWRRLERACSNRNPRYTVNLRNVQGLHRCTAAQNLALSAAAFDIIHTLSHRHSISTAPTNVVSVAKQDNELKGLKDDKISVHEYIISLDSLNHTVSQKAESLRGSFPTASSLMVDTEDHSALCTTNFDVDIVEESSYAFFNSSHPCAAESSETGGNKASPLGCFAVHHSNVDSFRGEIVALDKRDQQSETSCFSSHTSVTSLASTSSLFAQNPSSPGVDDGKDPSRRFSILCQIL